MMTFNAGNMPICEGCRNERVCDEGDLFYCALGEKIDSSMCARWQNNLVAQEIANMIGKVIDRLPAGSYQRSEGDTYIEDDELYRKGRLIDRMKDALADYFDESWSHDAEMLVGWPVGEMIGVESGRREEESL